MSFDSWYVVNGFVYLRNIRGTLLNYHETCNWFNSIAKTPLILQERCCVKACRRSTVAVSHVEIYDIEREARGIGIVTMCQTHHFMAENIGQETKLNGSKINEHNVVKVKKNFYIWLMPTWYQNMIRIAEYMYINSISIENFDEVVYTFEKDNFKLKMTYGLEISKQCPF